jgi:phage terminase large subunit
MKLQIKTPRWAIPLLEPKRYKGAYGGRGSGKSHLFAELLVEEHIRDKDMQSVCVREIQKSLQFSSKKLIESKIHSLGVSHLFDILQNEIRRKDGRGLIIFQGLQDHTADSIKSLEGFNRAWVEEAQSISRRSMELLLPTIRAPQSEIWFSWNPEHPDAPVEQLFRNESTDAIAVKVNYTDNPFLPDTLKQEAERHRRNDPYTFAHVWLGEYNTRTEAQVFKGKWRVDDFETPEGVVFYFGADWGFSVDPTTLIRCFIHGGSLYIDYEAYAVGCEIDHLPALFDTVPESRRYVIRADSALPATISYMQRRGFKMQSVKKGPGSVEDGILHLRGYNEIIIHDRCIKTAEEFLRYSYKTDKLTGDVQPVLEDKWNHCIDALRYAVEPLIKSSQPVALSYTTSKARYR